MGTGASAPATGARTKPAMRLKKCAPAGTSMAGSAPRAAKAAALPAGTPPGAGTLKSIGDQERSFGVRLCSVVALTLPTPTKDCADTRPRRAVKPPPSPAAGGLWGFGARAPARTHDKAPRRAVKPPPSPAAGANSRARPTPNLGWRTCGAMGAAHAPRSAWTVQVRSGEAPRSPGPAARATDPRAAGPRAHVRAHSAALGVMGPATDTPALAEPLKVRTGVGDTQASPAEALTVPCCHAPGFSYPCS